MINKWHCLKQRIQKQLKGFFDVAHSFDWNLHYQQCHNIPWAYHILTVILSHSHLTWHWINKACMDKLTSYEMMLPMLMMLLQKVTGTRILDNSMECSRNNVFFLKMTTWDRMGMRKMCFEHVYFQRFMNRFEM